LSLAREQLQGWYRQAMLRRIVELRGLRDRIRRRDAAAFDAVRSVGQALRGSGGTFGYPELSAAATLVETATDADVPRRLEGLIAELHRLRAPDDPEPATRAPEWLAAAAGRAPEDGGEGAGSDLAAAWAAAAAARGVDERAFAQIVADTFGLGTADELEPDGAALRLVPETLMREHGIVPLREDGTTIHVATADPAALRMERDLIDLTGRMPVFLVAPPTALRAAVARLLDREPAARPGEAPPAAPPAPPRGNAPPVAPPAPRSRDAPPAVPPNLPRGDAPQAARPQDARPPAPAVDEVAGTLSVLVIDDDEDARLLVRTLLEKRGYGVREACDGLEALEVMRSSGPVDLVVVDLDMPRMDGLEFMWELRGTPEWSHIPAIVVTGERDEQLEVSMMEEGADDYVRKPLDPRLFLARVRATIRRAEA